MPVMGRQWVLDRMPDGRLRAADFRIQEVATRAPGPGEVTVRSRMLSIDPAMRAHIRGGTYRAQLQPGEMIPGNGLGEVIASASPDLKLGDIVWGGLGWQEQATLPAAQLTVRDGTIDLELLVGTLGPSGLSAFYGMFEIGRARPGETILISAAAGSVGTVAVQIAKLAGCRVIGIAGGAEKCAWLTDQFNVDAAIDYKAGDLASAMERACPEGVDVYFDNVGGEVLEAAITAMNVRGRIVCCGNVSQYDAPDPDRGIRGIPLSLVSKRIRMEGFLLRDFDPVARANAERTLLRWIKEGRLSSPLHIVQGFDAAPQALVDLLAGANRGKVAVRL